MLGSILYHRIYGELVVSEIIGDKYISVIGIDDLDDVKYTDTEAFFYKTAKLFRIDSIGKVLFLDEVMECNKKYFNQKEMKLDFSDLKEKVKKINNTCDRENKLISNVNKLKRFKVRYTMLKGNRVEVQESIEKLKLYSW